VRRRRGIGAAGSGPRRCASALAAAGQAAPPPAASVPATPRRLGATLPSPLLGLAAHALADRREAQQRDRERLGAAWADTGLIFTTKTGRPVEPRNLVRSFACICDDNGICRIRVHVLRHTTASLLRSLPYRRGTLRSSSAMRASRPRSRSTPVDEVAKRDAITRLNKLLGGAE